MRIQSLNGREPYGLMKALLKTTLDRPSLRRDDDEPEVLDGTWDVTLYGNQPGEYDFAVLRSGSRVIFAAYLRFSRDEGLLEADEHFEVASCPEAVRTAGGVSILVINYDKAAYRIDATDQAVFVAMGERWSVDNGELFVNASDIYLLDGDQVMCISPEPQDIHVTWEEELGEYLDEATIDLIRQGTFDHVFRTM